MNARELSPLSHRSSRSSCESLGDWYSGELRPKVARAARENRVDGARAAQLHRLMTELLETHARHGTDVQEALRVDGRASR